MAILRTSQFFRVLLFDVIYCDIDGVKRRGGGFIRDMGFITKCGARKKVGYTVTRSRAASICLWVTEK